MRDFNDMVLQRLRTIGAELKAAALYIPRLRHKPAVLVYWLLSARKAQMVLLFVVLVFPTFMPKAVNSVLEKIYPPITEKKIFGIFESEREDPRREQRQQQLEVLIWVSGLGITLVLFWLHIPVGVSKATALARQRETRADTLLSSAPSNSVLLYRSAMALASDPEYEAKLQDKIKQLDAKLLGTGNGKSDAVISAKLEQAEADVTRILDPDESLSRPTLKTVGANDRYILEQELGRGAMGVVYRAQDSLLNRPVAIKELPPNFARDESLMGRFQQEARALARLTHPNIVQIYDFFIEHDRAFISMELVEGEELDDYIRAQQTMVLTNVLQLIGKLAIAMAYAHERGVIHRDFKPANVLIAPGLEPKITDFGLAKMAQSSVQTQIGTVMGSPAFMSPEQAAGEDIDERSDIYSLGVTLYKMLTQALPFTGDAKSVMAQKLTQSPRSLQELDRAIPEEIERMVLRMLAREPENRYQSMNEVVTEIGLVKRQLADSSMPHNSDLGL